MKRGREPPRDEPVRADAGIELVRQGGVARRYDELARRVDVVADERGLPVREHRQVRRMTSFCTISYVPGVGFAVLPNVYWEARLDTNDGASAGWPSRCRRRPCAPDEAWRAIRHVRRPDGGRVGAIGKQRLLRRWQRRQRRLRDVDVAAGVEIAVLRSAAHLDVITHAVAGLAGRALQHAFGVVLALVDPRGEQLAGGERQRRLHLVAATSRVGGIGGGRDVGVDQDRLRGGKGIAAVGGGRDDDAGVAVRRSARRTRVGRRRRRRRDLALRPRDVHATLAVFVDRYGDAREVERAERHARRALIVRIDAPPRR